MPPITKEQDTLTVAPDSASRPGTAPVSSGDAAKQQPVALEVSVTVNGARTIDGSDKREPFSETTKTVLIFGNGAVIRLTSSVAPGQLLFLTNERTKKEVVCQVVKSKNYRNVSGYVELEFTEPVVGFWGMRFPGDRIGVTPSPSPAAMPPAAVSTPPVPPRTVAPSTPASSLPSSAPSSSTSASIVPPAIDSASLLGASKPRPVEIPAPVAPVPVPPVAVAKPVSAPPQPLSAPTQLAADPVPVPPITPTAPVFEITSRSDEPASFLAPGPQAPKPPATVDLSSLAPFFEVKPATSASAPPPPPAPPAVTNPETEALKQHTARLQEQLSNVLFTEPAPTAAPVKPAAEAPATPVSEKKELQESIAQVLEIAKAPTAKPEPVFALPAEPVKAPAENKIASLEDEELKIPAWLEPLARNSAAPSSTQELILREKAKRLSEQPKIEEEGAAAVATPEAEPADLLQQEASAPEPRMPEFGSSLVIDEEIRPAAGTAVKGSGKGLLFGAIAAGVVLLAGGGWWYLNQRPTGAQAANSQAQIAAAANSTASTSVKSRVETASVTTPSTPTETPAPSASSERGNAPSERTPTAKPASEISVVTPNDSPRNARAASSSVPRVVSTAGAAQPEAVPAQVKKPVLGDVHLATPKVSQNRAASNGSGVDEGVSIQDDQSENAAASLGSGLAITGKQPAAPAMPVPVGGDVKQAKLISPVAPVYPALAKSQRVQGAVTIDALIDATGRVTTMKIISGPTLLHQAAMDALKQWKYQPATLDGKAVPMHLTVTIQFRLQE